VESEGDKFPVADLRRMMIRMFNLLKEELTDNMQKQLNEYKDSTDLKKILRRHKELNEVRALQQTPK
jgi:hypothetical protein